MAVHDGHDIGPGAIHLAMNEALEVDRAAVGVERIAVEVEFDARGVLRTDRTRAHDLASLYGRGGGHSFVFPPPGAACMARQGQPVAIWVRALTGPGCQSTVRREAP